MLKSVTFYLNGPFGLVAGLMEILLHQWSQLIFVNIVIAYLNESNTL